MAWNVVLLIIVVLFMILAMGVEFVLPPTAAEALAEEVAPRVAVSEDYLRAELTRALSEGVVRRAIVRATPFAFLALLLIIRLIQEARGRRPS
jgi:hypothetical protein